MNPGLPPKQEAFAQAYFETGNASEAYRRAYPGSEKWKPESIHVKASKLLATAKVQLRVAQLQTAHAKRHEITVDDLVAELETARMLAHAEGHAGAAVSATMGKAKLLGLVVDRNELSGRNGNPIPVINGAMTPQQAADAYALTLSEESIERLKALVE